MNIQKGSVKQIMYAVWMALSSVHCANNIGFTKLHEVIYCT